MNIIGEKISASILSANFLQIENEINKLIENNIKIIHCDVMDGVFVPNISFGQEFIKQIHKKFPNITIDTHLMITQPEKFINEFIPISNMISFHFEATKKSLEIIETIKSHNKKVGIAIKPNTSFQEIEHLLPLIDFILIMTVEPGFSGQKFMENQIEKIKQISNYRTKNNLSFKIHLDGGLNDKNILLLKYLKIDIFAMASYIFNSQNLKESLEKLKEIL